MTLLNVKNLHVFFADGTIAVDHINFSIDKGETVALVGESGSGKSITALAIMQLLPHAAKLDLRLNAHQEIIWQGKDLFSLSEVAMRKIRGRRIGMIFQEALTALNPVLTIGQQIDEIIKTHQLGRGQRRQRIDEILAQVGLPNPQQIAKSYAHQLSGGMRQRAMIAIALSGKPELLIADEPTTSLDVTIQAQILKLLKNLQQQTNMSLLFITHDLGIVKQMADRIIVMQKGSIIEENSAELFFDQPQHDYSQRLLHALPSLQRQPEPEEKIEKPIILEVEHLKTYFPIRKGILKRTVDYVNAVDDVSFTLEQGKTLALVGESGSGKTTTALSILRLIPATGGRIVFQGNDIFGKHLFQLKHLRKNMQIVFQDPYASMNPRMLVEDIIAEGLRAHRIGDRKYRHKKVMQLLALVGLEKSSASRYPHEFSGGQRQRICIARALALAPKFIICDEPTSALDATIQMQILDLLKDLQNKLNIAYLLITHNIGVVNYLAHDVAVMYQGKIVEYGSRNEVLFNPKHDYTKKLLNAVPKVG